jgi:hypothetical protein
MAQKSKSPIYTIRLNKAQTLRIAAYATLLSFIGVRFFQALVLKTSEIHALDIYGLIAFFGTFIVHELIHGAAFKLFGGRPKYGVGVINYFLPYAYATCPGQKFNLKQMTIVALAPLVIICSSSIAIAIAVPGLANYCLIVFSANFAGAIGDVWLLNKLYKFRKVENLQIVDAKDGLDVYGSGSLVKSTVKRVKEADNPKVFSAGFVSVWLTASAVLFFLSFIIPILLSLGNLHTDITIGPNKFPIFQYQNAEKSTVFTINPLSSALAGLIFATFLKFLSQKQLFKSS